MRFKAFGVGILVGSVISHFIFRLPVVGSAILLSFGFGILIGDYGRNG